MNQLSASGLDRGQVEALHMPGGVPLTFSRDESRLTPHENGGGGMAQLPRPAAFSGVYNAPVRIMQTVDGLSASGLHGGQVESNGMRLPQPVYSNEQDERRRRQQPLHEEAHVNFLICASTRDSGIVASSHLSRSLDDWNGPESISNEDSDSDREHGEDYDDTQSFEVEDCPHRSSHANATSSDREAASLSRSGSEPSDAEQDLESRPASRASMSEAAASASGSEPSEQAQECESDPALEASESEADFASDSD